MTVCPDLLDAIERYFDTMYDFDLDRFDALFEPTAQLHGLRDGDLRVLPAATYRGMLAMTPSPKSKAAPRLHELISIDVAAPTQAMAKVRVRIDALIYLDYLLLHRVGGSWRITAKSFHIAERFDSELVV